jgi:hypothetical protein
LSPGCRWSARRIFLGMTSCPLLESVAVSMRKPYPSYLERRGAIPLPLSRKLAREPIRLSDAAAFESWSKRRATGMAASVSNASRGTSIPGQRSLPHNAAGQ